VDDLIILITIVLIIGVSLVFFRSVCAYIFQRKIFSCERNYGITFFSIRKSS
jgi:hypothetical protein